VPPERLLEVGDDDPDLEGISGQGDGTPRSYAASWFSIHRSAQC
jgi:hypothetical protein